MYTVFDILDAQDGAGDPAAYDAMVEASGLLDQFAAELEESHAELGAMAIKMPGGRQAFSKLIAPRIQNLNTLRLRAQRPLVKGAEATRHTCPMPKQYSKKAITAEEKANTVRTVRPVFARLLLPAGALSGGFNRGSVTEGFDVFDRGISEDATPYGYADGKLRKHATNLRERGRLPSGHYFIGHGVACRFERVDGSPMPRAELAVLNRGQATWAEDDNSVQVDLGDIGSMPPVHRVEQASNADAITSAETVGPLYMSKKPLFWLRDSDENHKLALRWEDPTYEIGASTYMYIELRGEHGQVPTSKAI